MDRPIRVLQLAESPYFGGINSHIRAIKLGFRGASQVDIRVGALPGKRADNWLFEALPAGDVDRIGASTGAIRAYVAQNAIDVVHTHNYRATVLCATAKLKVPVVNTCHGQIVAASLKLRGYQWLELRAMRKSRLTIAVSKYVKDWLTERGLDPAGIRTIYNGYEPPKSGNQLPRTRFGIDDDATIFLFAGRLVREKGVRDFLRALRGCAGAYGLIVGDGPLRRECAAAAKDANAHVYFAGPQRDVAAYFRLADVVVLPSIMEALPMTLIEAAAHSRPVIATPEGGIPEVVQDGSSGILVEPGDIDHLRAAMLTLRDGELREDMGAASHARWLALFRRARMVEGLAEAYRDALAR